MSLGSGHLGSFDRRKCKATLNGSNATGDQRPEGWSFYQYPGPGFPCIGDNSAEAIQWPRVPGHEAVGVIDALGNGIERWRVGQRVGVGFLAGSCGHCKRCGAEVPTSCTARIKNAPVFSMMAVMRRS